MTVMAELPVRNSPPAQVDDESFGDLVAMGNWHLIKGYPAVPVKLPDGRWRQALLHRVVMGCTHGDGSEVDHIDRDPLNARRSNLRFATHPQNMQNQAVLNTKGTSQYRGVAWDKDVKRWRAYVYVNRKRHQVGWFDDEHEAGAAVAAFRRDNLTHSPDRGT